MGKTKKQKKVKLILNDRGENEWLKPRNQLKTMKHTITYLIKIIFLKVRASSEQIVLIYCMYRGRFS